MNDLNEYASHINATRGIDPDLPFHPSLVHMLRTAVEAKPEVTAVVCEDRRIDYAQFGRAVEGLARRLDELGVAGGRVAVMIPNSIETDVAVMAVMAANAQVAPINPFFTMGELTKVVSLVDAAAILCVPDTREKAEEVANTLGVQHVLTVGEQQLALERWVNDASLDTSTRALPGPDDLALLIFTGGSTGTPKGVDHTHRGLVWSLLQHCSVWPLDFGAERFLSVAPMFHIWGLSYAAWVPIFSAGTLVIVPRYDPDKMVRALGEHRITVFGGGPAPIYMGLLASPVFDEVDLSALKYCLSGGAPCPADLHREWEARAGQPLLEGWGMTEGAPFCLNPCDGRRKLMSVGNPVPETEVQVVDLDTGTRVLPFGEAGEVRVRGPQLMIGYRNNPEETRQTLRDGWIYTGDIGYADRDGYLYLVDRKKDIVIVGGYNVYPREVDEVLFHHPKIREAATVGRPDDLLGEVLVAFVVLARGQSMDEEEFFAYCKEQMVKYKRPVEVFFVDELPKTGPAKINRRALRERLAAARGTS
jgi:long-chain acyl-CoA synthetase